MAQTTPPPSTRSQTIADGTADGLYTMAEAARLKGVSYHTVSRAVRRGRLSAQRLGRMALITADDLREWRPQVERAPHKYRHREPDPTATPVQLDLASSEPVERAHALSVLLEAIHGAASDLPLGEFLSLLCDRLATALNLKRAAIWCVDRERGVVRRLATFGPPLSEQAEEMPLTAVPAFVRFLEGESATASHVSAIGAPPKPIRGVMTLFVAPLRVGNRALGTMQGDRGGAPFGLTPEQFRLAQGLADHAALALELAQLRAEIAALRGAASPTISSGETPGGERSADLVPFRDVPASPLL